MADNRVCQGYVVIDSIRVGKTEVVLAHNPNAPAPYVTWKSYAFTNYREFAYGCYFADEKSARASLRKRAAEEMELLLWDIPIGKQQRRIKQTVTVSTREGAFSFCSKG